MRPTTTATLLLLLSAPAAFGQPKEIKGHEALVPVHGLAFHRLAPQRHMDRLCGDRLVENADN